MSQAKHDKGSKSGPAFSVHKDASKLLPPLPSRLCDVYLHAGFLIPIVPVVDRAYCQEQCLNLCGCAFVMSLLNGDNAAENPSLLSM